MHSNPFAFIIELTTCCRRGSIYVTLLLLLLLTGCGGTGSTSSPNDVLTVITVTPAGKKVAPGTPVQFTAIGHYLDGNDRDVTDMVTWRSSDSAVASVSNAVGAKGFATAITPGSVDISATLGTITGVAAFTPTALNSLAVTPTAVTLVVRDPYQFTATGALADGSSQELTSLAAWSSSDYSVAAIDPTSGAVYATKAGSTTIKAVFFNMSATSAVTVLDAPI